ncbi:hypothetical protein L2E82_04064 [Cichorium intybus]|uniref:Uncharacterized protein n=1 Tax=Cichorium intybus TaxID=13427 RepID=A0ACB9H5G6_CICIN|nr:hypothetical protein L2E82_04064 [Cichorium intybus]
MPHGCLSWAIPPLFVGSLYHPPTLISDNNQRAESNSGAVEIDKKRKRSAAEEDELDETATMDVSGFSYDSDEIEPTNEHANGNGSKLNAMNSITIGAADQKG